MSIQQVCRWTSFLFFMMTVMVYGSAHAASVSGRVTNGAAGIANVEVMVFDAAGTSIIEVGGVANPVYTDSAGQFGFSGLPAGTYKITFDATPVYLPVFTVQTLAEGQTLVLPDTVLSGISPLGTIRGSVTTQDLTPVIGGKVVLYTTGSSGVASDSYYGEMLTSLDGSYQFSGLPVGQYKVQFAGTGQFAGQWYNGKPSSAAADTLTIAGNGEISNVNAVLAPGGGLVGVGGGIRDFDTNAVLAGVTVSVYDIGTGHLIQAVASDAGGDYALDGIAAGTYKVLYTKPGYQAEYYKNSIPNSGTPTPVTVTSGQTTLDQVLLAPTGSTRTLTYSITGNGSITSNPSQTFTCVSGACSSNFQTKSAVSLLPTPGADSTFGGFSGDCVGATCTVLMDADKNVIATFNLLDPVRTVSASSVTLAYFKTLQDAYNTVSGGESIQLKEGSLGGNFAASVLNNPNSPTVKILGGFNADYSAVTSRTVLSVTNPVRISAGKVIFRNVAIRK